MTKISDYTKANKTAWNASASAHALDFQAQLKAAGLSGFNTFDPTMTELLNSLDLVGKTAAQVGCNNARELVSLASFGAVPMLGVDQAARFLAQGTQLANAAGVSPRLLEADIYDLPRDVGQYDIVLITIGVLNWMPDLARFFEIVAGLLAPNGQLILYETHPFLEVFDPASETPFEPTFDYFASDPDASDEIIAYDGADHGSGETSYWFTHRFSDIIMRLLNTGLRLDHLREYPHSNREVEYDIYTARDANLPMCFSLIATKP